MQAAKHGKPSELRGAAKEIRKSMKKSDLADFTRKKPKNLPTRVGESYARSLFERDDAPKLGLGKTGLKFARMTSKQAFSGGHNGDAKWKTSAKLRAQLAGEKPGSPMKSMDKVGTVKKAIKESRTAPALLVKRLLDY